MTGFISGLLLGSTLNSNESKSGFSPNPSEVLANIDSILKGGKKLKSSSIPKKYCTQCGKLMLSKVFIVGYDQNTGVALQSIRYSCPEIKEKYIPNENCLYFGHSIYKSSL